MLYLVVENHKPDYNMSPTGAVIIFFILLFIYSKFGPAIPLNFTTQSRGEPLIVSAEGKSVVTPDIAKVSVGIEQSGTSLKTTQEAVNKKSQSITAELKKLGVDEKDIKTVSYNVYPENNYQANPPTITGYRVSISYEVTIKDIEKVNDVLVALTAAGANTVGGVTFDVSDDLRNEKMNEAREEAAEKAKEKAKGLAHAAGINLGKIINVSESQDLDYGRPVPLLEKVDSANGSMPTPADIQPGETEIVVTVSLSYEVR